MSDQSYSYFKPCSQGSKFEPTKVYDLWKAFKSAPEYGFVGGLLADSN
jgi:hypothetical protein